MLCVDTSLLVSLFVEEEHSSTAWDWVSKLDERILLSPLNELEFVNAMELRVFRQQLSQSEVFDVDEKFSRMKKGEFFQVGQSTREIWTGASVLARKHSSGIGTRSLDIWQVAFALHHQVRVFGTFDRRQRELANLVGLEVNPMD